MPESSGRVGGQTRRTAIIRLVLAAITFVVFVAGVVVLLMTGSSALVTVGVVLLIFSNVVWLPADIRSLREQFKRADTGNVDGNPRHPGA